MNIRRGYILAAFCFVLTLAFPLILPTSHAAQKVSVVSYGTKGSVFLVGNKISSFIQVKNQTKTTQTYWIGASILDPRGVEFPVLSHMVTIPPGKTSGKAAKVWDTALLASKMVSGKHTVILSVWDSPPENGTAHRLAYVRCQPIDIFREIDHFTESDSNRWIKAEHPLGRGSVLAQNTMIRNGQAVLTASPASLSGAEIQSTDMYLHGTYQVRLKTPVSPSSLTGFFLYTEPDFHYEIDIEIINQPRGTIMFTTYAGGKRTNTKTILLGFDPAKAFHEYRFDYYPNKLSFYVDGQLKHTVSSGLPQKPMRLMVNHWFPDWLPASNTDKDQNVYIDWVKY